MLISNPILNTVVDYLNSITNEKVSQYAMTIVGTLKDRFQLYSMGTEDRAQMADTISKSIVESLGMDFNIGIEYNLLSTLKGYMFVIIICNSLCDIILFFFMFICLIMTYNLVHNNMDERTFDFGMLRTQGFTKCQIVATLTFQTLSYSISAFVCSIITSYSLNTIMTHIFTKIISYPEYNKFDYYTILVVAVLSLIFPVFTNLVSISKVMSKYIRDSIDLLHNSISDVKITFAKLESVGMSFTSIMLALALIISGSIAFYVIPFSILAKNYELFMFSMQIILFFMIIGAILVISPFIHYMHSVLSFLILCFTFQLKLFKIIKRNIESHKSRNVSTTIVLTIITAFAIFTTASFKSQTSIISDSMRQLAGSEVKIYSLKAFNDSNPFHESNLRSYMDQTIQQGLIRSYSFISSDLPATITNSKFSEVRLSNNAKSTGLLLSLNAIEENYTDSVYTDLLQVYKGSQTPINSLYDSIGNWPNRSSVFDECNICNTQGAYLNPPIISDDSNYVTRG